jgi:hypothetical protein
MRGVSELYGRHAGSDIYIVGTGASMRVFPHSLLEGRITIGLNMAWKQVPVTYGVTIHPDLNIPEFLAGESARPQIIWAVGRRKCEVVLKPDQLQYARENFFGFGYDGKPNTQPPTEPSDAGRNPAWLEKPAGDNLYVWSSIAQTAVNLAANLGARNIFLVGCDNCALSGNHHAHVQHTRWKGVAPEYRYRQYEDGMAEVRSAMRHRRINVVSLTPFVTLREPERDFESLCEELEVAMRLSGPEISTLVDPPQRPRLRLFYDSIRQLLKLR